MSRFTARLRSREINPNGSPIAPGDGGGVPRLRPHRGPSPPRTGRSLVGALRQPLVAAGVALVLVALIGYWGVYAASSKRTRVLLATHALPAGTVLRSGDLRTGALAGEASVIATLVPGRELSRIIGMRLSTSVPAGAPLPAGALAGRQGQVSALVLSVTEFDVVGAQLQPGDRVSVLATFGAGSGQAATRPVARNLEVLSVGEAPASADPSTATVPVAVSVTNPATASSLALANEDAKLDLLVEGQGASTAAIPPASQGSGTP